ncbi:MAG: FAD-dependent oxidoreductase [Ardenticatenaceae bacterium]
MGKIGTASRPLRVAIIGSGPSGFYAAGALLKQKQINVSIDMFDRLPTPYGLVRDGVAPDHQKIKKVTRGYQKTASDPRVRFFGHVSFGSDLTNSAVRRYYDQVVYAFGTPSDRQLGIPGEDLRGSDPATIFVGWYNAHPDYAALDFDLASAKNVAIIGNGNVAMDVARILAKSAEELGKTDIADYALARLAESRIEKIYVLGRRGPAQAKFTNPELREFGDIEGVDPIVDPSELELDSDSQAAVEKDKGKTRNMKTLRNLAQRGATGCSRQVHFRFLVSPVEVLGQNGRVSGLRLRHNRLEATPSGYMQAVGTEHYEKIAVDLVFRAIGYRGIRVPGVPFEPRKGTVPNQKGRVIDPETGDVIAGEYVVGWAKRGPSGVIGTNRKDAVETVKQMLADVAHLTPINDADADPAAALAYIQAQQPEYVSFEDWLILDQIEKEKGQASGRPRVKFTNISDMLSAITKRRGNPSRLPKM